MTKHNSKQEWSKIKRAVASGMTRKTVCEKYGIGQKKFYRIRKSTSYEDFLRLTREATRERQSFRNSAKANAERSTTSTDAAHLGNYIASIQDDDKRDYTDNEKTAAIIVLVILLILSGLGIAFIFRLITGLLS